MQKLTITKTLLLALGLGVSLSVSAREQMNLPAGPGSNSSGNGNRIAAGCLTSSSSQSLDINNVQNGIYFLEVSTNGVKTTSRVVVQN